MYRPRTRHQRQLDGPGKAVVVAMLLLFCWLLGSTAGNFLDPTSADNDHPSVAHSESDHARFGAARVGMYPPPR